MAQMPSVCVFCGSRVGVKPAYKVAAQAMGSGIATRGWRLVYGGGGVGLMNETANAALAGGAPVIGVIPQFLTEYEDRHDGLTDLIVTDGMHDRKQIMFNLAQAFVILPGGVGTLDETMEILTWKQLGRHDKPIIIVNEGGYWTPMLEMMQKIIEGGFMGKRTVGLLDIVDTVDEAFALMETSFAGETASN